MFLQTAGTLVLYLTHKCNLKCSYCFGSFTSPQEDCDIDNDPEYLENLTNLVNRMEMRGAEYLFIVFFGGEPTIRWDLCKKIYYHLKANTDKKLKFSLQTNGTLIDRIVDDLKVMEDLEIYISFDYDKAHHDQYRVYHNDKGSWDKVRENVNLLMRGGLQDRMAVVYTYLPDEAHTIYDNVVNLYNMGFRSIRTSIVKEQPMTQAQVDVIGEQHKKVADFCFDHRDLMYHKFGKFKPEDTSSLQYFYKKAMVDRINIYTCNAGVYRVFMTSDGLIYPCSALIEPSFVLGDVKGKVTPLARQMETIWSNPKCFECDKRATCLLCIHRTRRTTGSCRNTCPSTEESYSQMHKECIEYYFNLFKSDGSIE